MALKTKYEKELEEKYAAMSLEELVEEFFSILDSKEESDSGRVFQPTYISSCRVIDSMKLGEILPRMREKIKE